MKPERIILSALSCKNICNSFGFFEKRANEFLEINFSSFSSKINPLNIDFSSI